MKKTKKEKRVKKKNGIIFIVICLILVLSYFILNKKIDCIYVLNNNYLKESDILSLAGLDNYPKVYQVSTSKIRKRLLASPFIKDAKVSCNLFSITINISEYQILWYQEFDNSVMLSSKENVLVSKNMLGLPVLTNQLSEQILSPLVDKYVLIKNDVINKISEITYDPNNLDNERFLLYMNDGNYVYINISRFEYLNTYNELLPKLEGKKGILYLDSGNHFEIKK